MYVIALRAVAVDSSGWSYERTPCCFSSAPLNAPCSSTSTSIVFFAKAQTSCSVRAPGLTYLAAGRTSTPSRFCSRMCALQPAVREHANIAGASDGGTSATSSTTADQYSTFVHEWLGLL